MEILNNIWNALSTENAALIKIISVPCTFIEIYLTFRLFTAILKTNYTKKQLYVYVISVSLVSIITSIIIPEPYNVFINYAFIFILLLKYFQFSIIQSIADIIFPFAIFGLVNSLLLNPFIKIFNTTYDIFSVIPIYRLTYLFCIYLIVFLMLFLFKQI